MIDTSTAHTSATNLNSDNSISKPLSSTSKLLEKVKKGTHKSTSVSSKAEVRTNYLLYVSYVDYSSEYKM